VLAALALADLRSSARDGLGQAAETGPLGGAYAELPGRRIWYRDSGGTGVPVVFLHASAGSSLVWEHQIPAFREAGYRFIAYDRVGFGRSSLEAGADPGTAADDLESMVRHLKIDRFHLVGTAAGGIVSLDYALSFPGRLRSLVLANTIGGVQDPDYLALQRRLRPTPQFDALPTEFKELGPAYRAANPEGMSKWVALAREGRAIAPLAAPQRNRNTLVLSLLEKIGVPVLLITGDGDLYSPPPVLRLFAARIRGCETLIVPETGHSAYWEQPEIFNQAVLRFLQKH
jgi:pimeloyl-ACP methyl ester carboxylesterase